MNTEARAIVALDLDGVVFPLMGNANYQEGHQVEGVNEREWWNRSPLKALGDLSLKHSGYTVETVLASSWGDSFRSGRLEPSPRPLLYPENRQFSEIRAIQDYDDSAEFKDSPKRTAASRLLGEKTTSLLIVIDDDAEQIYGDWYEGLSGKEQSLVALIQPQGDRGLTSDEIDIVMDILRVQKNDKENH